MMRSVALIVATGALLVLQPSHLAAQAGRQGGPPNLTRQEMVQRIQRQFQERIARELQLDDSQRDALTDVFRDFGQARARLLPRRTALAGEIRELLAGERPSDVRATELLQESRQLRQEEARLLEDEEDRLLDVLSPTQVLRLQTLRDQFGEQIRRLGSAGGQRAPRP